MSDQDGGADKPFAASQKKLDDARKKGEIPKSVDLTTAAAYSGFFIVCLAIGHVSLLALGNALIVLFDQSSQIATITFEGSGRAMAAGMIQATLSPIFVWFAAPAVFAVVMIVAQRAFVFTPSKVAPKINRISPLAGLKNKFGREGLFAFFKSTLKLLIYMVILGIFLAAQIDTIIGSVRLPPALIIATLGQMVTALLGIVVIIAIILGVLDFLWQSGEHQRKHRMSRQEMLDELKQSEGDPAMKQQRRMRGQEIAMNKMLADVPQADVIIVNPTHYAVAFRWDRHKASAPVCVAKGVDEIAARIRELAYEHAVPVHSDPVTARALHAGVAVGDEIAPDHYQAVAAAIRFAEMIRNKARRK